MKISVCIPCYNVEQYLQNLFKSLDGQTFKDFEVIFVDDGSTDNTNKIIQEYINKKDKNKFKLFKQENKGLAETRNVLIKHAQSDYIFFLDSDDTIPDNALEVLWMNSDNGKYDIVVGRSKLIIKGKIKFPFLVQYRYLKDMTNTHYVKSNLCTCWGSIIKKKMFDNEKFLSGYSYEDIGLINYIYLKATSFKSIKDITYLYWRREDSISNFNYKNRWKIIDIYEQFNHALNKYRENGMLQNKKYRRSINGTIFQVLISTHWLSKYYSNNKLLNTLPVYGIYELLKENNLKLRFSKTFWKSLSFFYIKHFDLNISFIYKKIKRLIYKNKNIQSVNDFLNLLCKKIIIDNGNLKQNEIDSNKKSTFVTENRSLNGINVLYVLKPKSINKDLLLEKKLHILDLTEFKNITDNQITLISKINKRIIVFLSVDINIENENIVILR